MWPDPNDPYTTAPSDEQPIEDPIDPPPDANGWWEFINGAWRWITNPAPSTIIATE